MATAGQNIFKKIVLYNKLLNEPAVDRLLRHLPDPELAVKFLVKREKLTPKKAGQLLKLYHKQLDKHLGFGGASHVVNKPVPDQLLSATESFEAMFDEIVCGDSSITAVPPDLETPAETPAAVTPSVGEVEERLSVDVEDKPEEETSATDSETAGSVPPVKVSEEDRDDEEKVHEQQATAAPTAAAAAAAAVAPAAKPTAAPAPAPAAAPAPAPAPAPVAEAAPSKVPVAPSVAKEAGPIDPLAKQILLAARAVNASDVHIKSGEIPILRVAGRLVEIEGMEAVPAERCEQALLSLCNDERRQKFLETNDLDFCYDGGDELGRFRTNFMRQHRGMDGIFRLISSKVPSFEELKLPPLVKKFTEYKQGIVLVTGPKGCGKTTTLAAMVDLINSSRPEHIITVEDPIEFVHPCKKGHVNQREVGVHTQTFSAALRAALREAPDVIMVGEMRDLETTSLAITAAETGHLVFATLHTPDALRTIDRILDVFPPKEQGQIRSMISESMRGIISQLLVPSVDGKSQELAVEILVNTVAIGNLIREAKTFQLRGVMQTGRKLGMQLMDDSLIGLVKANKVSKEDVLAVATERKRVESELGA